MNDHHLPGASYYYSALSPSRTINTTFTPRKPPIVVSAVADNGGMMEDQEVEDEQEQEGDWVLCLAAESDNSSSSGGGGGANGGGSGTNSRTLACALSNGLVQVYDQERLHLTSSHAIFAAQNSNNNTSSNHYNNSTIIHDLIYGPQNVLIAASHDGGVSVLDLRMGGSGGSGRGPTTMSASHHHRFSFSSTSSNISNSSSTSSSKNDMIGVAVGNSTNSVVARAQLPHGHGAALCVSLGYDGYLCAVGSNKARVHFFDLRSPHQLLGSYVDAHTNEVTRVQFGNNSTNNNTLLTASEDGLVCLFDTTQPTEESALRAVLNMGAPCRKVGFCGQDWNTIYCLTGSESVSFWNADSATCVLNFGAATRQLLSQTAAAAAASLDDGCCNTVNNMMSMDYLVDAHWDATSQELLLLAGTVGSNTAEASSSSSIGDTALFRLAATNNNDNRRREYIEQQQQQQQFEGRHHYIGDSMEHPYAASHQQQQQQQQQKFELCHVLRGGHRGLVRGWCSLSQSIMVTAGEDARLCEWNRRQGQGQPQQQQQQQQNHQHRSTFLSAPPPQRLPHQQLVAMTTSHAAEQVLAVHDHHYHHHSGDTSNSKRSASPVGSPFRRQRHRY